MYFRGSSPRLFGTAYSVGVRNPAGMENSSRKMFEIAFENVEAVWNRVVAGESELGNRDIKSDEHATLEVVGFDDRPGCSDQKPVVFT